MYLKELYVENNGPLERVHLKLPFTPAGMPKPVVLVGGNGSGKTNLLSIIGDALMSAAASYYTNVLHGMTPTHKPWFRLLGARTIRTGAAGSFTVMQFEHGGTTYLFKEKGGRVPPAEARARLPENLQPAARWDEEGSVKDFAIGREQAGEIFEKGVYVYFPSSRAETPHWLNTQTVAAAGFDLQPQISGRLPQPIYVEKALERLQQWILSVILESRCDFEVAREDDQGARFRLAGDIQRSLATKTLLRLANNILRQIRGDPGARFVWLGRSHPESLASSLRAGPFPPSEDSPRGSPPCSASSDPSCPTAISVVFLHNQIPGICLVDEIDAHMHVDLQHRALPELVRLFPEVQFIVSSHSPLFVLGMENTFGADGMLS